jgi:hypothetical protein
VRTRFRIVTVAAVAGLAVAGLAGPASAHVELKANKTTAGATDVTLTFNGEAENPAAGIKSERVVLPAGIAPGSVSAVKLPSGWTFTRASDGFTVGGKALKTGTDAVWSVKVAKLPAGVTRLSFKTLETYGNGDVSRWIEIQQPGQPEPDNPAPLLVLKPGSAEVSPASPVVIEPSATPLAAVSGPAPAAAAPATTSPGTTAQSPAADDSDGGSTWWIWVVAGALVVLVAAGLLLRRRRPGADGPPGQD